MSGRYAIYFTLERQDKLYQAAAAWLGHCLHACAAAADATGVLAALEPFRAFTHMVSLYGLHATLKSPFRLRAGASPTRLKKILEQSALVHPSFECAALKLAKLGRFVVLAPVQVCPRLNRLARGNRCVRSAIFFASGRAIPAFPVAE